MERTSRNLLSLSRYSRANAVNREMDGDVPRRCPHKRLNARALPLQRDGVGGGRGGASHGGKRHRRAARADGMHAEAQHRRQPHALLGGHTR